MPSSASGPIASPSRSMESSMRRLSRRSSTWGGRLGLGLGLRKSVRARARGRGRGRVGVEGQG